MIPVSSNSPVPCCLFVRSRAPKAYGARALASRPLSGCAPYGSRCTCVCSNRTLGWAIASIEVVRCVDAGTMSAPTITFSIIRLWIFSSSPPARRWPALIARYAAVMRVPVPQASGVSLEQVDA